MPERIQRRRTKGWRMPPDTKCVTRPGPWGNPFEVGWWNPTGKVGEAVVIHAEDAVALYRVWVVRRYGMPRIRADLAGYNLACWCGIGRPCHAGTLLELANSRPGGGVGDAFLKSMNLDFFADFRDDREYWRLLAEGIDRLVREAACRTT